MAVMRYEIYHIKINPRDIQGEIPLTKEGPRMHRDVSRGHKPEPGRGRSALRLTLNHCDLEQLTSTLDPGFLAHKIYHLLLQAVVSVM